MPFQSISFIYLFLPVTLGLFLFLNYKYPKAAVILLIIASLLFCGYNDVRAVIILVVSILFNYSLAVILANTPKGTWHKKSVLIFGIVLNFLFLSYYKFFSPSLASSSLNHESFALELGIPLGLSFYTLYQISLLVDVYKGKTQLSNFKAYMMSATMFAHLPAGPILIYKKSIKQFIDLEKKRVEARDINMGISLFTFGLFKKSLLADPMSLFTHQMFESVNSGTPFTFLESLFTSWGFLLQLYFDFSAYSDMAIGLGLCFGLKFPVNFNSPLKAKSFTDYISRWHISLITFNREYIFIPVSKLMLKVWKGSSTLKYYFSGAIATLVVFISIGFWHSPSLQFLLSGIVIGIILVSSQMLSYFFPAKFSMNMENQATLSVVNQFKVLFLSSVASCLLMLNGLSSIKLLLKGFITFNFEGSSGNYQFYLSRATGIGDFFPMIKQPISFFGYESIPIPFTLFILLCSVLALKGPNSMEIFGLKPYEAKDNQMMTPLWASTFIWGVLIAFLLAFYLIVKIDNNTSHDFIYGQF